VVARQKRIVRLKITVNIFLLLNHLLFDLSKIKINFIKVDPFVKTIYLKMDLSSPEIIQFDNDTNFDINKGQPLKNEGEFARRLDALKGDKPVEVITEPKEEEIAPVDEKPIEQRPLDELIEQLGEGLKVEDIQLIKAKAEPVTDDIFDN